MPGDLSTRESVTRTGDRFTVDYVMPSRALKNFVQVDTGVSVGDDATEVVMSMVIRVR